MREDQDQVVPLDEVKSFYSRQQRVYDPEDHWHLASKDWIARFVTVNLRSPNMPHGACILNLGSGGENYGLSGVDMVHVDLVDKQIAQTVKPVVADAHRLPFADKTFDICICVGSVLNYCDAGVVINSMRRVLKPGGRLIVEFESSTSAELLYSPSFNKSASIVQTFYNGNTVRLWAYSERYVSSFLCAAGFTIQSRNRFYHIPPLIYLLTKNANFSAKFLPLDRLFSRIPLVNRLASNIIFSCVNSI